MLLQLNSTTSVSLNSAMLQGGATSPWPNSPQPPGVTYPWQCLLLVQGTLCLQCGVAGAVGEEGTACRDREMGSVSSLVLPQSPEHTGRWWHS